MITGVAVLGRPVPPPRAVMRAPWCLSSSEGAVGFSCALVCGNRRPALHRAYSPDSTDSGGTSVASAHEERDEVLLRSDSDGIATMVLNRPAEMNCLTEDLISALDVELRRVALDTSIACVVIEAAGKVGLPSCGGGRGVTRRAARLSG